MTTKDLLTKHRFQETTICCFFLWKHPTIKENPQQIQGKIAHLEELLDPATVERINGWKHSRRIEVECSCFCQFEFPNCSYKQMPNKKKRFDWMPSVLAVGKALGHKNNSSLVPWGYHETVRAVFSPSSAKDGKDGLPVGLPAAPAGRCSAPIGFWRFFSVSE